MLQVRAKYQGLTTWKKGGCMQDFAMKIITSGTTLAELGRDCHTQAMVCHPRRARCRSASALYTAPHVSPPRSCTRLRHRGIHIAPPACFGLPSICHILPLQARTRSRPFSRISASSTASAAKALHPSPADSRHLRARPLPQECSAVTLSGARGLQKQPRPSARRSARPTRACGDAKCASPTRSANSRSPCSATSAATHAKPC